MNSLIVIIYFIGDLFNGLSLVNPRPLTMTIGIANILKKNIDSVSKFVKLIIKNF